jgi:hypothetical protein
MSLELLASSRIRIGSVVLSQSGRGDQLYADTHPENDHVWSVGADHSGITNRR